MERNNIILDTWYENFKDYKVLSNKEAKNLLKMIMTEKDEEKKDVLRNEIVLGTMGYVYNFLKNSAFINLTSNYFDMEDIISSAIEVWINIINNPAIIINSKDSSYAIDSKFLFSHRFYNHILNNLVGINCKGLNHQISLENKDFVSFYYYFLTKNGKNITYEEFYKILLSQGYIENYLKKLPLKEAWEEFHFITEMINFDGQVTMDKIDNLKNYYYASLKMLSMEKCDIETEDEIINRLVAKDYCRAIFVSDKLTLMRKKIIYELFFNDKNPYILARKSKTSHQNIECARDKSFKILKEEIKKGKLIRKKDGRNAKRSFK